MGLDNKEREKYIDPCNWKSRDISDSFGSSWILNDKPGFQIFSSPHIMAAPEPPLPCSKSSKKGKILSLLSSNKSPRNAPPWLGLSRVCVSERIPVVQGCKCQAARTEVCTLLWNGGGVTPHKSYALTVGREDREMLLSEDRSWMLSIGQV